MLVGQRLELLPDDANFDRLHDAMLAITPRGAELASQRGVELASQPGAEVPPTLATRADEPAAEPVVQIDVATTGPDPVTPGRLAILARTARSISSRWRGSSTSLIAARLVR